MWYKLKRIMMRPNGVEKQIRPDNRWQPWANTIAYYPFETDTLDAYWTTTISISWTQESIWYSFTSSSNPSISSSSAGRFISIWIKFVSRNGSYCEWPKVWYGGITYNFYHTSADFSQRFQYNASGIGWVASSMRTINAGEWKHLAYWYDSQGHKVVAYINWNKVWEYNSEWPAQTLTCNLMRWWTVVLSQLILENQVRAESDIIRYYNQTKSNYWL